MPKTVNLFGHQVPRGAVIAGVVVIVGGGGYYLYKRSTKAVTASSGAAGSSAYGYGSGGYGAYGYGQAYGYGMAGYGQFTAQSQDVYGYGAYGYGYYDPATGQYLGSGFGTNPTSPTPPATSTNQEWAQAATAGLVAQGFVAKNVATALGLYLTGKALNTDQQSIVTTAIGLEGEPPQDGAGGYPPAMHTTSTNHNPKPGKVTVPKVTGEPYALAAAKLKTVDLVPRRATANVGVVTSQNPRAGSKAAKGTAVVLDGKGSPNKRA